MRLKNYLSIAVTSMLLCLWLAAPGFSSSKKKKPAKPATAAVQQGAGTYADQGSVDQRITAVEAEIFQLSGTLTKLNQDSVRIAGEMARKLQSAPQSADLDEQRAKKTREISALRLMRDKARQDSISAVTKPNEKFQQMKREAARLEAMVIASSNQLNTLSSRRQQIAATDGGADAESRKAAAGLQRDIVCIDSIIAMKKNELSAGGTKRDQLHLDSLGREAKASESRSALASEGRRIDSLLTSAAAIMNEAASQQSIVRQRASNNQEQSRLGEIKTQKLQVEAQIAVVKAAITASTADRERLRAASGSAEKKIDEERSPIAALLTGTEAQLSEKLGDKEALKLVDEMIQLDSAIEQAKDSLNGAIEQKAVRKKGADKSVDRYEAEVSRLMGRLDDVKRINPKVARYETQLAGFVSITDKRNHYEKFIASSAAEIASLTMRRDQAKKKLEEFDRTHPSPTKAWAQRVAQLDSMISTKENAMQKLSARRDSIEIRSATQQNLAEGVSVAAQTESRKADSVAALTKKQWSDLTIQRARIRGDSLKNESALSIEVIRLRAEQAKIIAQTAALDKEIALKTAEKERLKHSATDAQNREEQSKAANLAERKRLDSLIAAKEGEVAQLSLQNEKISQDFQSLSREMEQEMRKQGAAVASITARIAAGEQEMNAISRGAEAVRKERAALEKVSHDTLKRLSGEIAAVRASMASKMSEEATFKNQRMAVCRTLQAELVRLDSMITAEGQAVAGLEGARDRVRRDSAAAESSKSDAALRGSLALRRQDSLTAQLQSQLTALSSAIEKARQDSIAASASPSSAATPQTITTLDSLIVFKEREIAELRGQREKARQDAAKEKQKQSSDRLAAYQNIMNERTVMQRKQTELLAVRLQREKLQKDSAATLARIQSGVQTSASEISRHNALITTRKMALSALQVKRSETAAKVKAMGVEPLAAVPASAGNIETAQKIVEEIYTLIGSDKIDEAIGRFSAQRTFLSASVNPEAFQVLNYAIDQALASRKVAATKK